MTDEKPCACSVDGDECMAPAGCDDPDFDHPDICCACFDECPQ